jgi:hypothetical protein
MNATLLRDLRTKEPYFFEKLVSAFELNCVKTQNKIIIMELSA